MIQRYHAYGTYAGDDGTFVDYADHTAALAAKDAELAEMEARKDAAYLERNQCVALIATMAHALGHWAGIARTAIEGWSEDWHGCVYIDLPAGQVSWHYHDSQAYLFAHLPPYCGEWDGHDTPEKYRRVLQRPVSNARAERAEAEAAGLRADAERWRAVSAMMTHEHRADAVGWTLGALLPGDDPDAAIDATLTQEDHND